MAEAAHPCLVSQLVTASLSWSLNRSLLCDGGIHRFRALLGISRLFVRSDGWLFDKVAWSFRPKREIVWRPGAATQAFQELAEHHCLLSQRVIASPRSPRRAADWIGPYVPPQPSTRSVAPSGSSTSSSGMSAAIPATFCARRRTM